MTGKGFEVVRPGALTTVQDLGRPGRQSEGFTPGGAMDRRSMRLANLLAGNDPGEAVLEATFAGPVLTFHADCVVALAGADMRATLDGEPLPCGRAKAVRAGQTLSLAFAERGLRTYVAFTGGLDVAPVMGSRSTSLALGLGGCEGRALRAGDFVGLRAPAGSLPRMERRRAALPPLPDSAETLAVRALPGPQEDRFTRAGIERFYETDWVIDARSDRMGYRLIGPAVETVRGSDILSDAVAFGSVQIDADGGPIVMMADRQTTGGYAKIAAAATADLPLLAQARPGMRVRFVRCTQEEAVRALRAERAAERRLLWRLRGPF